MPDKRVTELTAIDLVSGVDLLLLVDDPAGTPLNKKATVTQLLVNTARTDTSNTFNGDQTVDGDLFVTGEVNPVLFAVQKAKINLFTGTPVGDPSGSRTVMSRSLVSGLAIRHDEALAEGRLSVGNYDTQIYQPLKVEVESFQVHTGISPAAREERLRVHPSGGVTVGTNHVNDPGVGSVAVLTLDLKEGIPIDPPSDTGRLYALDVNGYTQVEMRDANAKVVRFASDNILIAKVSGVAITRGQAVYLSGASGANPLAGLSRSDVVATMPCVGLALDSGVVNAFIRILVAGTLQLLDTSAFAEGARLYVSPTTAGSMTTTAPIAPNYAQRVGIVTRSHATQGEVLVLTTSVDGPPRLHRATHEPGGSDALTALDASVLTTGALPFARVPVSGASKLLGRGASGAGDMEEVVLGTGLTMSGTTLNATQFVLPTNIAYKDQANVFTADQEISKATPHLDLRDTSGSANAKLWRIEANFGSLAFMPRTDAGAYQFDGMALNRNGTASFYGVVTFAADTKFSNGIAVGGLVQIGSTIIPSAAHPALRSGSPGPKLEAVTGTQGAFVPFECLKLITNGAGTSLLDLTVSGGTTLQSSVAVTGTLTASGGLTVGGVLAVNAAAAKLDLRDTSGGVDAKLWRIENTGFLSISPCTDAGAAQSTAVNFYRGGSTEWYGPVKYYAAAEFISSVQISGNNPGLKFGGTTASYPALRKQTSGVVALEVVSADTPSSVMVPVRAAYYLSTAAGNSLADLTVTGATSFGGGLGMTAGNLTGPGSIVLNGGIQIGTYFYPGAVTNPGVIQSSWYLGAHSSYGLYSNTGIYLEGGCYPSAVDARGTVRAQSGVFEYNRSTQLGGWIDCMNLLGWTGTYVYSLVGKILNIIINANGTVGVGAYIRINIPVVPSQGVRLAGAIYQTGNVLAMGIVPAGQAFIDVYPASGNTAAGNCYVFMNGAIPI